MNEDVVSRAEQEVRSRGLHACPQCGSIMHLVTSPFKITQPFAKRYLALSCSSHHCGVRGPFAWIHSRSTTGMFDAQLKAYSGWLKMVENLCKQFAKPPRERQKKITPPKKKAKE